MRLGIIVDGYGEFYTIKSIVHRATGLHGVPCKVLRANLQPFAPVGKLTRAAESRMRILVDGYGATHLIALLDAENWSRCAPEIQRCYLPALREALNSISRGVRLDLVIKVVAYENWLIADPDAFESLPGRFPNVSSIRGAAAPNRADSANAMEVLKANAAHGESYHKVRDAKRIVQHIVPERAAKNSRSFRRFLRVLGHGHYRTQSRNPA